MSLHREEEPIVHQAGHHQLAAARDRFIPVVLRHPFAPFALTVFFRCSTPSTPHLAITPHQSALRCYLLRALLISQSRRCQLGLGTRSRLW
mmetsp:Transcript_55417/g.110151  ORF Transcript_55417/g.110151 Transcript_55417/m.110151 type:complete len:91 (+) Transcript_55417:369-641(+)